MGRPLRQGSRPFPWSAAVLGIPTYILVGKDGTVRFRDHELPGDLAKLLE